MNLGMHDLHMELDAASRRLTLWDANHKEVFACEARNRTTKDGQLYHDGNCPPGEFILGNPSPRGTVPFGPYFIPILDYFPNHAMQFYGRSGIGIHGGGTGLASPMALLQGWQITHGCWRVQNEYLLQLVSHVNVAHGLGGKVYVTVAGAVPGAVEEIDDWGPRVELFPDE